MCIHNTHTYVYMHWKQILYLLKNEDDTFTIEELGVLLVSLQFLNNNL